MAKMKKADVRRQSILNDLLNNDCCTYEYLMEQYDISERAMQMDIKELCKQGYKIKGIKAKRGYVLTQEQENAIGYYESTDLQKIRKLFILQILQNSYNGRTIGELMKWLEKYNSNGVEDKIDAEAKDNTTVRNALNELIEAKMVVAIKSKNEENKEITKYMLSANAPLQLAFSESEAMEILNLLETCAKGHHHEKTLNAIQKKIKIALWFDPEDERKTSSAYVVYNKSFETAEKLDTLLQELNGYPFETKMLKVTYVNRLGEANTIRFSVGNVVYSVDKDKLYLLGECEVVPLIIQYSTISKIEVLEEANTVFRNHFYSNIVKDMFAISVEKPEWVKVEFDDVFAIKEKLSRLLVNRPNAKLYKENDKLYYVDYISGIHDFANYLRRYGSCCQVLEPPSLRALIKASADRILENYKRLEEELQKQKAQSKE